MALALSARRAATLWYSLRRLHQVGRSSSSHRAPVQRYGKAENEQEIEPQIEEFGQIADRQ
jgi:hypothetical protein